MDDLLDETSRQVVGYAHDLAAGDRYQLRRIDLDQLLLKCVKTFAELTDKRVLAHCGNGGPGFAVGPVRIG